MMEQLLTLLIPNVYQVNMIPKNLFWKNPLRTIATVFSCFRSAPRAYSYPLRLAIENGVGCNFNCKMCALRHMERKRGFITFNKFKQIYDQVNPPYLNLTGYTDSFMNKDIFKMIRYGKAHGSYVKLDTNAMIMNNAVAEDLLLSGADEISISIDGSIPKIYEEICVNGNLDIVKNNVKGLVNLRNKTNSKLRIDIAIVVQRDNIKDLVNTIKMVDDLGVDEINPTPVVEYDIKEFEDYTLDNVIYDLTKALAEIETSTSVIADLNLESLYKYIEDHKKGEIKYTTADRACYTPWHNCYITWEGDVVPCCYYYDKQICFGNVFKQCFAEIWNNDKYKAFRKTKAISRDMPICQTCRNEEVFLEKKFKKLRKIPLIKWWSYRR